MQSVSRVRGMNGSEVERCSPESTIPKWVERHYAVAELADLWNLSHDSITRMFRNEPGVLVVTPRKRRGCRTRTTLRIPESVATRVYERMTTKAA